MRWITAFAILWHCAAIFAWILVSNQIAAHLSGSILSISDSPAFVMLAILLIVLVLGLFLETVAAITILVPVLLQPEPVLRRRRLLLLLLHKLCR